MTRKAALLTEALTHFVLCLTCYALLSGSFAAAEGDSALAGGGTVLFFLLAYGLRPFLGVAIDEYPRIHSMSVGCLAVTAALLFPPSWAWAVPMVCGLGYALFGAGIGGESLCFARGYFLRNGVVLATGILGAAVGSCLGPLNLPVGVYAVLLIAGAFACFFFAESRKYPRRIRSFRHSVLASVPRPAVLFLSFFPLFVSALTPALLPTSEFGGYGILIPVGACALGRVVGAFAADRFGPRKAAAVSFGIALPLMTVFTHLPWVYCVGLVALNGATAVSFGAATAALPSRPHFVFGMGSVALLAGCVPCLFSFPVTPTLRMICGLLLVAAMAVSYFLYTDHCKIFSAPYRMGEKGEKK